MNPKVEVTVSQDCATALQPGDRARLSQKKEKKKGLEDVLQKKKGWHKGNGIQCKAQGDSSEHSKRRFQDGRRALSMEGRQARFGAGSREDGLTEHLLPLNTLRICIGAENELLTSTWKTKGHNSKENKLDRKEKVTTEILLYNSVVTSIYIALK